MRQHPYLGVVLIVESAVYAGAGFGEAFAAGGRPLLGVVYVALAIVLGRVGFRWTEKVIVGG